MKTKSSPQIQSTIFVLLFLSPIHSPINYNSNHIRTYIYRMEKVKQALLIHIPTLSEVYNLTIYSWLSRIVRR